MYRNPDVKKPREEEEEGPYLLHGHTAQLLPAIRGSIPAKWIHIPDDVFLEAVLADGKAKRLNILMGFRVEGTSIVPQVHGHIAKRVGNDYFVWDLPDDITHLWREHKFRGLRDLITNPRSIVGLALRARPQSDLYYQVGGVPKNLEDELTEQSKRLKSEAEEEERRAEVWRKRADELAERLKAGMKKNPDEYVIPGKVAKLRARRLNRNYGAVYLARVRENDKGNYAVWADSTNTFYTGSPFDLKYGYPAKFDLKYYGHYPQALEDYLTRRELRRPVPIGGR